MEWDCFTATIIVVALMLKMKLNICLSESYPCACCSNLCFLSSHFCFIHSLFCRFYPCVPVYAREDFHSFDHTIYLNLIK